MHGKIKCARQVQENALAVSLSATAYPLFFGPSLGVFSSPGWAWQARDKTLVDSSVRLPPPLVFLLLLREVHKYGQATEMAGDQAKNRRATTPSIGRLPRIDGRLQGL